MEPNIFFDLQAHHFQQHQNRRQIKPRTYGNRSDPGDMMTEQEFKRHFRLTKNSVTRLCELLKEDLKFKTERLPFLDYVDHSIINHLDHHAFLKFSVRLQLRPDSNLRLHSPLLIVFFKHQPDLKLN